MNDHEDNDNPSPLDDLAFEHECAELFFVKITDCDPERSEEFARLCSDLREVLETETNGAGKVSGTLHDLISISFRRSTTGQLAQRLFTLENYTTGGSKLRKFLEEEVADAESALADMKRKKLTIVEGESEESGPGQSDEPSREELLSLLVESFDRAAVIDPVSSLLMRARDYLDDTDYNKQVLAIALSIVIANPYTPAAMRISIAEHLASLHGKANIQDAAAPEYITEWLPLALRKAEEKGQSR